MALVYNDCTVRKVKASPISTHALQCQPVAGISVKSLESKCCRMRKVKVLYNEIEESKSIALHCALCNAVQMQLNSKSILLLKDQVTGEVCQVVTLQCALQCYSISICKAVHSVAAQF